MTMQQGGWYGGKQFWDGVLGPVGKIINPNQIGNIVGGAGKALSSFGNSVGNLFSQPKPTPPPIQPIVDQTALGKEKKSGPFGLSPDFSQPNVAGQSGQIAPKPNSSPAPTPINPNNVASKTSDWQQRMNKLDLSTFEGRQQAYAIMQEQIDKMMNAPVSEGNVSLSDLLSYIQKKNSPQPQVGQVAYGPSTEQTASFSLAGMTPQQILTQFKSKLDPDMIEKIQKIIAQSTSGAAAMPNILTTLGIKPQIGTGAPVSFNDVVKKMKKKRGVTYA